MYKWTEWGKEKRKEEEKEMAIGFEVLLEGSTNKCFRVTYGKDTGRRAFMRVQGAGSVLSNPREQEMALFQIASREGLGPRLYAVYKNGYMAEYAKGRVLKAEEMRGSGTEKQKAIIKAVARWHSLDVPSTLFAGSRFPFGALVELARNGRHRVARAANISTEGLDDDKDDDHVDQDVDDDMRGQEADDGARGGQETETEESIASGDSSAHSTSSAHSNAHSTSRPHSASTSSQNHSSSQSSSSSSDPTHKKHASDSPSSKIRKGAAKWTSNMLKKVEERLEAAEKKRRHKIAHEDNTIDSDSEDAQSRRKKRKSLSLKSSVWSLMDSWLKRAKKLYASEDAALLAQQAHSPSSTSLDHTTLGSTSASTPASPTPIRAESSKTITLLESSKSSRESSNESKSSSRSSEASKSESEASNSESEASKSESDSSSSPQSPPFASSQSTPSSPSPSSSPTFAEFMKRVEATQRDVLPFYALPHAADILCHNDLNHGNLLYDEAKSEVWAVDLEFAGFNHRGFDLGNHFCEWASLELHYEFLPTDEEIRTWLHLYLDQMGPKRGGFCLCQDCRSCKFCFYCHPNSYHEHQDKECINSNNNLNKKADTSNTLKKSGSSSTPTPSSSSTPTSSSSDSSAPSQSCKFDMVHVSKHQVVEEMLVECRKWMQVSHLFWWLWGMIQIKISNVEGFDAKRYCQVRWNEYEKAEEAVKRLPHPPRLVKRLPSFIATFPQLPLSPPPSPHPSSHYSDPSSHDHPPRSRRRRSSSTRK